MKWILGCLVLGCSVVISAADLPKSVRVQLELQQTVPAVSTTLHIVTESTERSFERAAKSNQKNISKLKKAFQKKGIPDGNISIDEHSHHPKEGFIRDSVSLKASMEVTVKDQSTIIPLSKVISSMGDNTFLETMSYDYGDTDYIKAQLTPILSKKLKQRQSNLEKSLGIKLVVGEIKEQFYLKQQRPNVLKSKESVSKVTGHPKWNQPDGKVRMTWYVSFWIQ